MLVTDLGVLETAASLRTAGEFPADLQFKISVQMGLSNPAAIRLAERLGADTYNVPTDMSLGELAAVRAAVDIPLDVYIESPDDLGGFVRHAEIADIVRVAAPVYLKFGLANSPGIYPSGTHLDSVTVALGPRTGAAGADWARTAPPHDAGGGDVGGAGRGACSARPYVGGRGDGVGAADRVAVRIDPATTRSCRPRSPGTPTRGRRPARRARPRSA